MVIRDIKRKLTSFDIRYLCRSLTDSIQYILAIVGTIAILKFIFE